MVNRLLPKARQGTNTLSRRDIQRNAIPTHLRRKAALDPALSELIEAERVRLTEDGRRKCVYVNPALLKGDAT